MYMEIKTDAANQKKNLRSRQRGSEEETGKREREWAREKITKITRHSSRGRQFDFVIVAQLVHVRVARIHGARQRRKVAVPEDGGWDGRKREREENEREAEIE